MVVSSQLSVFSPQLGIIGMKRGKMKKEIDLKRIADIIG
jgi:hypothetical protein